MLYHLFGSSNEQGLACLLIHMQWLIDSCPLRNTVTIPKSHPEQTRKSPLQQCDGKDFCSLVGNCHEVSRTAEVHNST